MSKTFALYTDENILSITKMYSQRVEDAIGKKRNNLHWMLVVKKVIPAEEFQAAFAAIQAGDDNLQIFEHIWSTEAKTLREVWKILVGMQKDNAKLREIIEDIQRSEMTRWNCEMGEEHKSNTERHQDGGMDSTSDLQQHVEPEKGDVGEGKRSPSEPVANDEDGRVVSSNSAKSEEEIEGELSDTSGQDLGGKTDEMREELQGDIERRQDGGMESTGDLQQHVEREEGDVGERDGSPTQPVDNDEDGRAVSSDSARSEEEREEDLSDTPGESPQETAILHREFLRNWSKNLKYVQAGSGQTAGTRSFEDLYTDLRITGATTEGVPLGSEGGNDEDVEPHQLLKRNNTEKEETSTIMVHGIAGSGKSTLIQKIIHDWANKSIYKEFKYIFSFRFQTLNAIKYVTNLNSLILEVYPYLATCLEDLWKDPKTILFILDDMDEFLQSYFADADGNGGPSGECMYPDYNGYVRDILTYLIQGRLVKGCFLLFTTRPWRLQVAQKIPVTSTYHLQGFTPEKVKEYFNRCFGDQKKAEQLVQRVEACESLGTLYVNPLFCSIVASLPEWSQVVENPMVTMGHTRVLSEYLTTIMGLCALDEQTSRQSLLHLGEAAYKKIRDQSFLFEAQSLSELNRCLSTFTSALMMETPGKGERDVIYKFNYPILQNFVAALVKSPGGSPKMLNEVYMVPDDRFNIFSRFLVGLSSRGSTKCLERVLGSISPEALSSIADWIKKSVRTRHSNLDGKTTQGKFLNILHCLFEFGDPQLATEALDPMRAIKFNHCSLNTFDCVVLSSTLICCGPIEELDLSSCGVKQKGIRYLQPVLCKCKVLRLKSNQLADDCIESLISVVQTNRSLTLLDLSNCDEDKQKMNAFTAEKLQTFVQNCRQEREIRWAHHEDIEQKDSKLDKASNILTIITE